MDKYFEFKYWSEIIGLIVACLFILIVIIWVIITTIISNCRIKYRKKSKKWKYNYFTGKWEKVNKLEVKNETMEEMKDD